MRDDLVGSVEASRIIDVPYSTFMRWVADGRIIPVHVMPGISGAKLFSRDDVLALAAGKAEAAS